VGDLLERFPSAKVVCHPKAVKHLINPEKLWIASKNALGNIAEAYGEPKPVDESRVISANDYEEFDLGDDVMLCVHTPGHAVHQVSFYLKRDKVLFPGDSAGVYAHDIVVPTTPPPFMLEPALKSIDKMLKLKPEFIAFTHFGIAKAKDGKILETLRRRLNLWCKLAIEVVDEGGGMDSLHSKLLEKDDGYRELFNLTKDSVIISGFHMMTLTGLLDFATSFKKSEDLSRG
jgi:glyoxylase-like metal-dependent hydrolase (beta-lactamase superfamily II)